MSEHDTDPSVEQKIDQLYRSLRTEQPPASLDRQILDAAHHAVENKIPGRAASRNIWLRSLAYAAVVIVGVSVLFEVRMQPEFKQIEPSQLIEKRMAPLSREVMSDDDSGVSSASSDYNSELDSRPRSQMEQASKIKIKTRQKVPSMTLEPRSAETPASAAAEVQMFEMAAPEAEVLMQDTEVIDVLTTKPWRSSIQLWLQECQQLLADSKAEELAIELAEFRRKHEDYPLPQDLLDWLQKTSPPQLNH